MNSMNKTSFLFPFWWIIIWNNQWRKVFIFPFNFISHTFTTYRSLEKKKIVCENILVVSQVMVIFVLILMIIIVLFFFFFLFSSIWLASSLVDIFSYYYFSNFLSTFLWKKSLLKYEIRFILKWEKHLEFFLLYKMKIIIVDIWG